MILRDLTKSLEETKPTTRMRWPDAAIAGAQKHTHNQNSAPPARDREHEKESLILVDVEKGNSFDVEKNDPRKHEKESSILADVEKGNSSISIDVENNDP